MINFNPWKWFLYPSMILILCIGAAAFFYDDYDFTNPGVDGYLNWSYDCDAGKPTANTGIFGISGVTQGWIDVQNTNVFNSKTQSCFCTDGGACYMQMNASTFADIQVNNFTWGWFVYVNGTAGNKDLFNTWFTASNPDLNNLGANFGDNNGPNDLGILIPANEWFMIFFNHYTGSTRDIYMVRTDINTGEENFTYLRTETDAFGNPYWNNDATGNRMFTFDQFFGFRGNITDFPKVLVDNPPVVNHISPPNNTRNNSVLLVKYNYSDTEGGPANCSLYVNNSLIGTNINHPSGITLGLYFMNVAGYPHLVYNITCCNSQCAGFNEYYYNFDNTTPEIFFNSPYSKNANGSIYLSFNASDNQLLYNAEINISRTDDDYHVYENNISLTGIFYQYNESIPAFNFTNTTYTLYYRLCDAHTLNSLTIDPVIQKSRNEIIYNFDGIIISIESLDSAYSSNNKCLKDRCAFGFSFTNPKEEREFRISANRKIEYIRSSYQGHFIIAGLLWADFEGAGEVEVEPDGPNSYKVKIKEELSEYNFNSIGQLNCINGAYNFTLIDSFAFSYYNSKYMNDTQLFNLRIINFNSFPGVMMFLFSLILLAGFIFYCEYTSIPIMRIFAGVIGVMYSYLIFSILSVFIGISLTLIFCFYIYYGFYTAKSIY